MVGKETAAEPVGLDLESRQMVVDMIGQLRKRLLTREKILEFDKAEIFPEEIIREMLGPDIGLQLLFIPEEYGGMGGGARDCCAVTREMSKICLGVATAFFAIQLGSDPLLVGGAPEQKQRWLGQLAEGDTLVAYAVTEPGAGSNVAGIATKADPVLNDAGEITGYILNGTKQFISNGGYADFITVLAKTPEGPSFFVVEKGMPGFSPGKSEEKHGIRASNTSPLTLTDVFVPIENLIGGAPGQGLKQANKVFGYTRLMVAEIALGALESALDIAVRYAMERIQFGAPLSEKQGYTHKLIVPHAVRLEAASAYNRAVALRLDSGEEDLEVEGSIGKLFSTESANTAADDAIQALGGYGYIREFEVEKIKRDVKITCIYEGTSEIQQSIISMFRWKKTRRSKGGFYEEMAAEMSALHERQPDIGAQYYAVAARALNRTIEQVNDHKLTKLQHVMFAMSDMIATVEVGIAFAREVAEIETDADAKSKKLKAMCRIFAAETAQLVAANALKIVFGTGVFETAEANTFLEQISYDTLMKSCRNTIKDMDIVADAIFER